MTEVHLTIYSLLVNKRCVYIYIILSFINSLKKGSVIKKKSDKKNLSINKVNIEKGNIFIDMLPHIISFSCESGVHI